MGHFEVNVKKALETIAERKKGNTMVRERVIHDLATVYDERMTIREVIELGFAMADSDADVAEHIDGITLGEVLKFAERGLKQEREQGAVRRRKPSPVLDGQVVSKTAAEIRAVLKDANQPLKR